MSFEEFLKSKHVMAEFLKSRPVATDQRLQNGGNKPTAVNQIGQQKSLLKSPQGQQLKLKWSREKRDAVGFRAFHGIQHPEDPRNWGTNDELEALAKMYNVHFIVFETARSISYMYMQIVIAELEDENYMSHTLLNTCMY